MVGRERQHHGRALRLDFNDFLDDFFNDLLNFDYLFDHLRDYLFDLDFLNLDLNLGLRHDLLDWHFLDFGPCDDGLDRHFLDYDLLDWNFLGYDLSLAAGCQKRRCTGSEASNT